MIDDVIYCAKLFSNRFTVVVSVEGQFSPFSVQTTGGHCNCCTTVQLWFLCWFKVQINIYFSPESDSDEKMKLLIAIPIQSPDRQRVCVCPHLSPLLCQKQIHSILENSLRMKRQIYKSTLVFCCSQTNRNSHRCNLRGRVCRCCGHHLDYNNLQTMVSTI